MFSCVIVRFFSATFFSLSFFCYLNSAHSINGVDSYSEFSSVPQRWRKGQDGEDEEKEAMLLLKIKLIESFQSFLSKHRTSHRVSQKYEIFPLCVVCTHVLFLFNSKRNERCITKLKLAHYVNVL